MAGFGVNNYAKVWGIRTHEKYTELQVSCSTKDKQTGEYKTDFSGFVRCVGKAHEKCLSLSEKDSIKIGNFIVTNSYNKEKKITYTNIVMFDFELPENASNSASNDDFMTIGADISEDELPFS